MIGVFILALVLIGTGLIPIFGGRLVHHGVMIEPWTGWLSIFLGIILLVISIRAFLRGEHKEKPPAYTKDDITKAREWFEHKADITMEEKIKLDISLGVDTPDKCTREDASNKQ
ncbi:hypothetical protein LJB93_01065 [Desulfovibrio sp. OttesenSCG-928-F07]|nr:hypothetical protein [Desulfovibrio sp. OttesenSCG-928-F07]